MRSIRIQIAAIIAAAVILGGMAYVLHIFQRSRSAIIAAVVAGGLALAGCAEYQSILEGGVGEAVSSTRRFNDLTARTLYVLPGQMPLGGAIRTLTAEQLANQIRALGGPSFVLADVCMGQVTDVIRAMQGSEPERAVGPVADPLPPVDLTPEQAEAVRNALEP